MTMDKYREIVEHLDVGKKVKRLDAELDGDPATGAPGLRAAFFETYRDTLSQERLVAIREKMVVPPAQQRMAAEDLERARYQASSLRSTLAFLAEQIAATEAELATARAVGAGGIVMDEDAGPATLTPLQEETA
jgi:hypothetical protein